MSSFKAKGVCLKFLDARLKCLLWYHPIGAYYIRRRQIFNNHCILIPCRTTYPLQLKCVLTVWQCLIQSSDLQRHLLVLFSLFSSVSSLSDYHYYDHYFHPAKISSSYYGNRFVFNNNNYEFSNLWHTDNPQFKLANCTTVPWCQNVYQLHKMQTGWQVCSAHFLKSCYHGDERKTLFTWWKYQNLANKCKI